MPEPLTPELVEAAYRKGFFPMADDDGTIQWFRPDPRTIIPLNAFHIPRRLARQLRQQPFAITVNRDFSGVMHGCAARPETWIDRAIIDAYTALHQRGKAHSIEAWHDGDLVGGIYGVSLGGVFMGESMFSRVTGASKACLVHLVERLRARGYALFDVQFTTEHLQRFGAVEIARNDYLRRLRQALKQSCSFV